MTRKTPDPTRIYVARPPGGAYISPASQQNLPYPGAIHPGLKLRGDHPVVIEHPDWWQDVADDPDTIALADELARRMQSVAPASGALASAPALPPRERGRPKWTAALFRARWREAIERGGITGTPTYAAVAGYFETLDGTIGEIDPNYLGSLYREHGTE
jgi:hypothetical protein